MEKVRIVLDKELLSAVDAAARGSNQNRSQLVRQALREHLRRLDLLAREEDDRQGFSRHPVDRDEHKSWEAVEAWPAE